MDHARKNIMRISKILYIVARVVAIFMLISIAVTVTLCICSIFIEDTEEFKIRTDTLTLLSAQGDLTMFETFELDGRVDFTTKMIIAASFHAFVRIIIFWYAIVFKKIFRNISKGGQPFTKENARRLFIMSIGALLFVVINPILSIALFVVGLFISFLFKYAAYLNEKSKQTQHIQESMIISMAEVVENKSDQTGQHVRRVAEYSKALAMQLGFTEEQADVIKMASMMHDIGKLLVPSPILEKPGKLTPEEYEEIKKHTTYGDKLLKDVEGEVLVCARKIAYEHHERPDGKGYPRGLKKANISIEGKIVAVADVYDALTSKRTYKDAWDSKQAYDEIVNNSGTQFDKSVVKAFVDAYDKIDEIREKFADVVPPMPTTSKEQNAL